MCSWVKEKHEEFKKAQEKKKSKDADKSALKEISVRKEGGKNQQKGGSNGQAEPLMGYVSRHLHDVVTQVSQRMLGQQQQQQGNGSWLQQRLQDVHAVTNHALQGP